MSLKMARSPSSLLSFPEVNEASLSSSRRVLDAQFNSFIEQSKANIAEAYKQIHRIEEEMNDAFLVYFQAVDQLQNEELRHGHSTVALACRAACIEVKHTGSQCYIRRRRPKQVPLREVAHLRVSAGPVLHRQVVSAYCLICAVEKPIEEFVKQPCSHQSCKDCLRDYLSHLVNSRKVSQSDLVCPDTCEMGIPEDILKNSLSESDYRKLEIYRLPQEDEGAQITRCPSSDCDYLAYLDREVKQFPCWKCDKVFCLQCRHVVSDESHRCDQASSDEVVLPFEVKNCPRCREVVSKGVGCNFVQCSSPVCARTTFFCWICLATLENAHHYAHFPRGPYEDVCVGDPLSGLQAHELNVPTCPCSARASLVTLSCRHQVCQQCLDRLFTAKSQRLIEGRGRCPTCYREITDFEINSLHSLRRIKP
jgi:hypothetical protein